MKPFNRTSTPIQAKRSHHDKTKPGVSHTVALPITFFFKKVSYGKRRIMKIHKYFTNAKTLSSKNPLKRNQNPSRYYYNSIITNLKFQQHKPKYHLSKILI